jgi:hypothetical protein
LAVDVGCVVFVDGNCACVIDELFALFLLYSLMMRIIPKPCGDTSRSYILIETTPFPLLDHISSVIVVMVVIMQSLTLRPLVSRMSIHGLVDKR